MNALNSLMNPAAIGQTVQQGFQQGRQMRSQMETQNALSTLVTDPTNQDAMQNLARFNPQAAMQYQGVQQQRQAAQAKAEQEQQTAALTQRALQGDDAALDQLATVNFDRWKSVSEQERKQSAEESAILGQAALSLMNTSPEQRRGLFIRYAQDMPQFADKIQEVAFLPPAEQDAALRSVIVQAKLVEKLNALEKPQYQRLAPGEVFVNTKDPAAVSQFSSGGQSQGGGYANGTVIENAQGQRMVMVEGQWRPM